MNISSDEEMISECLITRWKGLDYEGNLETSLYDSFYESFLSLYKIKRAENGSYIEAEITSVEKYNNDEQVMHR